MLPLDEASRRRMRSWSALLCVIPLCLAPLAGRSSFEAASERARFEARFNAPALKVSWNHEPVSVARDPFVAEKSTQAGSVAPTGVVGMHVTQGQPIGFALPGHTLAVTVKAVVTGASPRALVDDGEHVRVVGLGDVLAGARITSIDASGVHLQNGTVLELTEGAL